MRKELWQKETGRATHLSNQGSISSAPGGIFPVTHQIRRHGKQANELDARVCHANVRVKGDSLGAGAAGAAGLGALADRCPISFS